VETVQQWADVVATTGSNYTNHVDVVTAGITGIITELDQDWVRFGLRNILTWDGRGPVMSVVRVTT